MDIVLDLVLVIVVTAALIWVVSFLDIGLRVSGFAAALSTSFVLAAYGLVIWMIAAAWQVAARGDTPFVLIWVGVGVLLWVAGKYVRGVEVKSLPRALLVALVLAAMYMGTFEVVERLVA